MPKSFYTKIVGVTKENRQELIEETIEAGDDLELFRQPDNPYDRNAIAVGKYESDIIGYLSADIAAELAPKIDTGQYIEIAVKEVTGGEAGQSYGVNVEVTVYTPEESEELRQQVNQNPHPSTAPIHARPAPVKSAEKSVKRKRSCWYAVLFMFGILIAIIFFSGAEGDNRVLGGILGIASVAFSCLMAYLLFFRK